MSDNKKNPFFNTISIKGWKPDKKKVEEAVHRDMEQNILTPRSKTNRQINRGKRG